MLDGCTMYIPYTSFDTIIYLKSNIFNTYLFKKNVGTFVSDFEITKKVV